MFAVPTEEGEQMDEVSWGKLDLWWDLLYMY